MKHKSTFKVISVILAVIVLFASCASSTLIESYPSGAKVYIDGEPVGRTPYWYTDTKIMGSVTNVDLVKDGFEPLYTSIARNERLDFGAVICGFYLLAPFLWSLRYQRVHSYELVPLHFQVTQPEIIVPLETRPLQPSQSEPISPKVQKMRELKQMLDENLITKDDFEKQKQKILDEK
jgi:hypothetical protein